MYQNIEYKNRFRILKGGLISLVVASNLYGAPSGGTVVSGNATINQSGNTTNINQSSQKASINWQDFSIKSNETVNFNQPNQNSITLNRVIGNEKSIIDGALNANGQVWLINSNGTLFGKNAKVNTSGFLVTTKNLSDEDFNKGNYTFKGDSKATIENLGEISSEKYAAFVANAVINNGTIKVHSGAINLSGASEFSINLDENSNIALKIDKGVLDALVENNNLLIANGGNVYLTTNAKNELLKGVVNNKGIIEANSLDDLGQQNEVIIFAHGGTANIDGTINAKGGFVETSGKNLNVTNNSKIVAKKWLLDPVNVTIDNSTGTVGNEKVGASVIQDTLNSGTSVTIQADNDINVNQAITYNQSELELNAGNNININKQIDVTGTGGLSLVYAQTNSDGNYNVNAKVNLANSTTFKTKKGSNTQINWNIVNNSTALQNMNSNKSGNYVVGTDINLSSITNWIAIGTSAYGFGGKFDGLGHVLTGLTINEPTKDFQGLFGYTSDNALIRNISLNNVNIIGRNRVGGLVGHNSGTIQNSSTSGTVKGNEPAGGLVGNNSGTIENSYAKATVSAEGVDKRYQGGLVGYNSGTIQNSYATGNLNNGRYFIGGLVGSNMGTIENSYATGIVSGNSGYIGGLVGNNNGNGGTGAPDGTITNSFYDKTKAQNGLVYLDFTGVTALTTEQMQHGTVYKTAGWDIVADSSLASGAPVLKWSDEKSKYVWAIAPKTITGNLSNQSVTYNGLLQNLSSIYTSQAIFGTDGMNFKFVDNSGDITAFKNAGTYSNIGVEITGTDEFTVAGVGTKGNLTINKANLDIVANSNSVVYNGNVQSVSGYTFGTNGLLGTDTADVFALSNATTTSSSKNVGNYATNIAQTETADNYNLNITQGKLEITKANLTLSGLTADNKVYDGNTTATLNIGTVDYTGKIASDDISINTAGLSATFANKNAGTHNINLSGVTLSGADANNYNVTAPSSLTASITQKEVTIANGSIAGVNKTYDGTTNATLSNIGTTSVLVGSEYLDLVYDATFIDKNAGTNKTIAVSYYLENGGNGGIASNYKIKEGQETTTTTAEIFKKDLTINGIFAEDKTYNGNTNATLSNIGNLSGLVNGEELQLTHTTAEFSDKNANDNKAVTVSGYTIANKGTNLASNYNLTETSKNTTANINKATITITGLKADNKVYDGNTTATVNNGNVAYEGIITGDSLAIDTNSLIGFFSNKNAGTHNINLSGVTLSGADANNYNYTVPSSLTATIAQKEVTIANGSIAGVSKTYNGTTNATVNNKGTLSGLVGSETLNLDYAANFIDKNAGTNKNIDVSYSLEDGTNGGLASNYKIKVGDEITTTTAVIYKKTVNNVSYTVDNKVYDGNYNAVAKGSSTDFIAGDKIGFTQTALFCVDNFDVLDANVGSHKDVLISDIALSGADSTNYNLVNSSSQGNYADITKKDLKVIVGNESKIYDGVAFNGGKVVYDGFVNGENESVFTNGSLALTGNGLGATEIGKYDLSASTSGFDAQNYNITYVDGVLDIKVKPSVIAPQNGEINKVVNSIQNVVQVFNPNQLFGANSTTADNQTQNGLTQTNTNPNTQTFSFGRNLGLEVVNGGINSPVNGVEDFEDLLPSQIISKR